MILFYAKDKLGLSSWAMYFDRIHKFGCGE